MKPSKTKRELRDELNQQMEQFLQHGGHINEVARGISGRTEHIPMTQIFQREPGSEERTLVNEVVAAIEARRKPLAPLKTNRKPRPRKKVIYDDFGQPLRWEWVEE